MNDQEPGSLTVKGLTREELFARIWEKPATEVARELGISDVRLGILCERLQVPKPPRGYWARVQSGRTPKRPPLKAFRTEKRRKAPTPAIPVRLTQRQAETLKLALEELRALDVDTSSCHLGYDGIRAISAELAAMLLLFIQNRCDHWTQNTDSARKRLASRQSIENLADKLLPVAQPQTLIFEREDRYGRHGTDRGPVLLVRLTETLQRRIVQLSQQAKSLKVDHLAWQLGDTDYAWSVKTLYSPDAYGNYQHLLCVSAHDIWVSGAGKTLFDERAERFVTSRIPIRDVIPVEILPNQEIALPSMLSSNRLQPFSDRLQALMHEEALYSDLSDSAYRLDESLPSNKLRLADRLWFGEDESPFSKARNALATVEVQLAQWERAIAAEQLALCESVLGVSLNDIVNAESRGKLIRLKVENMGLHTYEDKVLFYLSGTRYRKDGSLGKRDDTIYISIENDIRQGHR